MPPDNGKGRPGKSGHSPDATNVHSSLAGEPYHAAGAVVMPDRNPLTPDLMMAWASRYAAHGWAVFPCQPRGKEPATRHGYVDATRSPWRIAAWWSGRVAYNIGVVTGAPGPNVLDVDTKAGAPGFASYSRLKQAGLLAGAHRLVRTRSGGLHVYFAGTDQGCGRLRAEGLDYQARGGYVLVPPSYVDFSTGPPGYYSILEDRAPTGAVLDWEACKRLLRPPVPRQERTRRAWTGPGLPPSVQSWLDASTYPDDRSAATFGLVGACVRAGLDDSRIHQVVSGYRPAVDKYGDGARLETEIERAIAKIAGEPGG